MVNINVFNMYHYKEYYELVDNAILRRSDMDKILFIIITFLPSSCFEPSTLTLFCQNVILHNFKL